MTMVIIVSLLLQGWAINSFGLIKKYMKTVKMGRSSKYVLPFLIFLSQVVRSEIIPLELVLDASSSEVHFVRGTTEPEVMRAFFFLGY